MSNVIGRHDGHVISGNEKLILPNDTFIALHNTLLQVFRDALTVAIIQQVHYWTTFNREKHRNYYDGHYWVFKTYEDWQKDHFPWTSASSIRRRFYDLENRGILVSGQHHPTRTNRTKAYRINYSELERFLRSKGYSLSLHLPNVTQSNRSKRPDASAQGDPMQQVTVDTSFNTKSISETKSKTKTKPEREDDVVSSQVTLNFDEDVKPENPSDKEGVHSTEAIREIRKRLRSIFELYVERRPSELEERHLMRIFKSYPDMDDIEDAFLEFVVQRDKQTYISSPCGYVEGVLKKWTMHGKRKTNMLEHLRSLKKG